MPERSDRLRVLSADSHIVEPPDLFTECIDPAFFVCAEFEAGWAAPMLQHMDSAIWEGTHPYVAYDLPENYPHLESCWPDSSQVIDRILPEGLVPAEDRARILCENASRIYGWPEP